MGVSSAVRGGALGAVSGGLPQDAGQALGEWWGSGMGRPRRDLYGEMELERWLEQQFPAVRLPSGGKPDGWYELHLHLINQLF
ncbi:MAG: hypothetical protein QW815_08180 [Nitrososphaerota archaeon]